MKKALTACLSILLYVMTLSAKEINIIPLPKKVEKGMGNFILNPQTPIYYNEVELKYLAVESCNAVKSLVNLELQAKELKENQPIKREINLLLDYAASTGREGYRLSVSTNAITVKASTRHGLFYGVQTLLQLIPLNRDLKVSCVEIEDKPRFPWSGFMFDVSRYFFTIDELKYCAARSLECLAILMADVLTRDKSSALFTRIEQNFLPRFSILKKNSLSVQLTQKPLSKEIPTTYHH